MSCTRTTPLSQSLPCTSLEPDAVVHADGGIETKSVQSLAYLTRFNLELQKAGSRGLSILVAAGDGGVGCDGKAYQPEYPASFPAMTTVGGTKDAQTVN
jgi:subtilase family serine protease